MTILTRIVLTVFSQKHATRTWAHPRTHNTDTYVKKDMLHVKYVVFCVCEPAVTGHKTMLSEKFAMKLPGVFLVDYFCARYPADELSHA